MEGWGAFHFFLLLSTHPSHPLNSLKLPSVTSSGRCYSKLRVQNVRMCIL